MTLPSPSLKSAEEVAKEIAKKWYAGEGPIPAQMLARTLSQAIQTDRSRLIQYIREKMPKKIGGTPRGSKDFHLATNAKVEGWNSCIEAFKKLLQEVK